MKTKLDWTTIRLRLADQPWDDDNSRRVAVQKGFRSLEWWEQGEREAKERGLRLEAGTTFIYAVEYRDEKQLSKESA